MEKIIVLIGDIEESKGLEPAGRKKVQFQLQQALNKLSSRGENLLSPPTITLGDEFQAVYKSADTLFSHTWQIMAELYPVHMRFSAGIGAITTEINRKQAIGMDGPAFHVARRGIESLKESGFLYQISKSDDEEGKSNMLNLINGALHLMSREMRSWRKKRFFILHLLDQGISYKQIAQKLDLSESAVYKNRDGGSLDIIIEIKNNIASLINDQL